ncbi:MAG: flagellar protein FlgN [Deltaproteobacteria bacterium]|nr:flagellar protein FlgN [Deltaproteobacteria bacterium]MBW2354603.1 flagellar protein FlgN [Deltaproteobacteria bacterium]
MNFEPVNAYDNLLNLLHGEAALYRALLSVLQGEKDAIIGSNLGELGKTGKEKEELLFKIRIIEEQRQIMIKDLARSLGRSPHDLTITKLAELVEEPYSDRFRSLCSDLLPLARTIRDVNDGNKALLRHSVELIRSSFAFLNNLIAVNAVYYRSGRMQQNDQSGKVLCGKI